MQMSIITFSIFVLVSLPLCFLHICVGFIRRRLSKAILHTCHSHGNLTHWCLDDMTVIFCVVFKYILLMSISAIFFKITADECHKTSLMRSQSWFREWLVAIRQQAITWTNFVTRHHWVNPSYAGYLLEGILYCVMSHLVCLILAYDFCAILLTSLLSLSKYFSDEDVHLYC